MTARRAVVYLGGASLMAAWLASAAGVTRQPQRTRAPSRPGDAAVLQAMVEDVQAQTSRLRKRMPAAPVPQGDVRNPFDFRARRAHATPLIAPAIVQPAAAGAEPAVMEPSLVLLGIAEQLTPAGPVRTAMLSGGREDLIMATEGQIVLSRYRVETVAVDAVELKDVTTGAIRRLVLQ